MAKKRIDIKDVKGDVIGGSISGENIVGKEQYIAQNIIIVSSNAGKVIDDIREMSTEVSPDEGGGLKGNKSAKNADDIKDGINQILNLINKREQAGEKIEEVKTEDSHISRIELLIKKAILTKTEADQLWFDHVNKRRKEFGRPEQNPEILKQGFDYNSYNTKLKESYALLEEANKIDPANTEVLLHMSKLLMQLTPDDPTDEEKLLYRIQNLISEPANDQEKFRLAQANFFLSTSRAPINLDGVKRAKKMFGEVGRTEWVDHCDKIISQNTRTNPQQGYGYTPQPQQQQNQLQNNIQFAGRWNVKIGDMYGSTMAIELFNSGTFNASQQNYGMNLQASGQWSFVPYSSSLLLQGFVNGIQPFMMQVIVQAPYLNGFYGIGVDGFGYWFTK